ncbi:MAG: DUF2889 domain-containing protein [Myxococcota bacterium]
MLRERPNGRSLVYRRHLRLVADGARVVGAIEDNPHHFRVHLEHDGERVTRIEGESVRFPWSTCPSAGARLRALVGMPLSPQSTAVGAVARATDQCTHMFDLAGLAVAHAHRARGRGAASVRTYRCAVALDRSEDPARAGHTLATLAREDEGPGAAPPLELAWTVDGDTVLRPAPFAGVHLHARFMAWVDANLDLERAEAALVLRRACFVAPSRFFDFDGVERATELQHMVGRCHTFSEVRAHDARRMPGTFRDYTHDPAAMLGDAPGVRAGADD